MNVITLTTDMGLEDYYVAALKGKIISLATSARIIDISHIVKPFRITQAAQLLRNCFRDFPKGTVHVIGVDAEPLINFSRPEESILPIIVEFENHYFLGADNGVFSLILDGEQPDGIWQIDNVLSSPDLMKFPSKNIFIPAACKIINGVPLSEFCTPTESIKRVIRPLPVIEDNVIKGIVTHIDHYGNVITNISRADFQRMHNNTPFVIYLRRQEYSIDHISLGYNEVPRGEKVAIFNDSNYLEIAINKGTPENGGGASSLLGLKVNDTIRIEFNSINELSKKTTLF